MLKISANISIPDDQIDIHAIRAQGAGGQHVNKVSSAIHLRFDICRSSLPETYKARLLQWRNQRISSDGIIIIKAQQYRSQEQNKADALKRLQALIRQAVTIPAKRRPTRKTRASIKRRLEHKHQRSQVKAMRKKPSE